MLISNGPLKTCSIQYRKQFSNGYSHKYCQTTTSDTACLKTCVTIFINSVGVQLSAI